MKVRFNKLYLLPLMVLFAIGCESGRNGDPGSVPGLIDWIERNQSNINHELILRTLNYQRENPEDSTWTEIGFHVTKNDSTVLGEMFRRTTQIDSCAGILFILKPEIYDKKEIILFRDSLKGCDYTESGETDTIGYLLVKGISVLEK